MSEANQFFGRLFSSEGFVCRADCGWSDFHIKLTVFNDVVVAVICCLMVGIVAKIRGKRPDIVPASAAHMANLYLLFVAATHVADSLSFQWPTHRLTTALSVLSLIFGGLTAYLITLHIPTFLRLKRAEDFEEIRVKYMELAREYRHLNRDLQQQVLYRGILERENSIMRTLNFSKNYEQVAAAVATIDAIADELKSLMPEKFREAHMPKSHGDIDIGDPDAVTRIDPEEFDKAFGPDTE